MILGSFIVFLVCNNSSLEEQLRESVSNEKALFISNQNNENYNRELKLTVEQLYYFQDSILLNMDNLRRELDIKDSNLKRLEYLLSEARKVDTLVFKDTIFIENMPKIDTIVKDDWYSLSIGLEYPNKIMVTPVFKSEKYIITNCKKETIDPPKKCWIGRLFQRKHEVVEVNIIEKSPYIENKENKFIEIIK